MPVGNVPTGGHVRNGRRVTVGRKSRARSAERRGRTVTVWQKSERRAASDSQVDGYPFGENVKRKAQSAEVERSRFGEIASGIQHPTFFVVMWVSFGLIAAERRTPNKIATGPETLRARDTSDAQRYYTKINSMDVELVLSELN